MAERATDGGTAPGAPGEKHANDGADGHGSSGDRWAALRRRVYEVVEIGRSSDGTSGAFDTAIVTLILLNIAAFAAETVPSVRVAWGGWLALFEVLSVGVFTIEYLARLWTAIEVPFLKRLSPARARLKFARRPFMLIDLAAILPFYLNFIVPLDLRVLRVLRLIRLFKLSRYSPAMHTLIRVVVNERRSLTGAGMLLMVAVLVAATGMYYLEHEVQPEKFGSVPLAMYWATTTLTTVGYGDVAPVTPIGQLFASIVMVVGLCILALPVAIISTGFAQEVSRHDFVVTWSLMSRIPLLAELDATQVAQLMPLMHAHNLPPSFEVIARNSEPDGMYFIASGIVDMTSDAGTHTFRTGDFFGTAAVIDTDTVSASYKTRTKCRLLKLHRSDFHRLEAAYPAIVDHIRRTAERRRAQRVAAEAEAARG